MMDIHKHPFLLM